ncbi:MAG: excinuclease ABC subunit UvrA [Candidatus Nomurabacteria bacterium]|jgi:excinuclease ABC subunit A|nr:excinuclease ABC subunit UvrA [Candidatus Nomurabacteria bacterium]
MDNGFIEVKGARTHNLKNVDVKIPRGKLTVITGVSGSGKSSLAFDTIFAEGQRRYVESLSSYARQFLGVMDKPDVDQITGLSPAISIDQKSTSRNPRSIVATVTEIYDYMRLLYARCGVPHCPVCHQKVDRRTTQDIINEILSLPNNTKLLISAPIALDQKGEFAHIPAQFSEKGFARAWVDGVVYELDEFPKLEKQKRHNIDIIIDRLILEENSLARVASSVEQALEIGKGLMKIILPDEDFRIQTFSKRYACPNHPEIEIPELEPRLFSFNSPQGACPICTGLGTRQEIDPALVLNPNLTIAEGGIRPYNRVNQESWWLKKLVTVGERHNFSTRTRIRDLNADAVNKILYGTGDEKYLMTVGNGNSYNSTYEGVIPNLERRWRETESEFMKKDIERFMRVHECTVCNGARLKPVVLAVEVGGFGIMDLCSMAVDEARTIFADNAAMLKLNETDAKIAKMIIKEIADRLQFMQDVGLGYLTLNRAANTLSGGEAQRIRLATQIGSGLQGVLYVLDEPSIGLHQRDNNKLIKTLKHLRDLGNTVLVVEHDDDTIRNADYLVDVGVEAGVGGGKIVAAGTPMEVANGKGDVALVSSGGEILSLTGKYLSGALAIETPKKRRKINAKKILRVVGARENNLKNLTVDFPLGLMTVVAGVSGSGKSTLVNDILANELLARLHRAQTVSGLHEKIEGIEHLDKAIVIDQSPIGRTPRSNPATYTGIWTPMRELFASLPESNVRGLTSGRFSFNVRGGRCEKCQGDGAIKIEMNFLPDVWVTCDQCGGKRYNPDILEIKYKDKTIADVLDMTIAEAYEFFATQNRIASKLKVLVEVGLGYIKLGQSATTLSGGEAQRIKLATELSRQQTGKTLYILDEPTTGLHAHDVRRLVTILQKLVAGGGSMIIIEHNLDVIKNADYVIDMGPEGGEGGGLVIATGTPEEIARDAKSPTGFFLKEIL